MMATTYGVVMPDSLPMSHVYDALLDYTSGQMTAAPQASQTSSRALTSQQRPGPAMRIHKPRSANSNPRSSGAMHRRSTMGVVEPGRHRQAAEFFILPPGSEESALPVRQEESFRPLSWHASSYLQHQQSQREQLSGYPFPTPSMYAESQLHFSPMMDSYSNETSPCSIFSAPPLFPGDNSAPFVLTDGWGLSQKPTPTYTPSFNGHGSLESFPTLVDSTSQRTVGGMGWDVLPLHEFHSTSPPTPESHPCAQPAVSDLAAPYEVVKEAEEGEILVGMGLYDAPDKIEEDPQINNYRSTVTSLLGSSLRPLEPRGKGLKLEETWEPPQAEDDSEQDSDGDDSGSSEEDSEMLLVRRQFYPAAIGVGDDEGDDDDGDEDEDDAHDDDGDNGRFRSPGGVASVAWPRRRWQRKRQRQRQRQQAVARVSMWMARQHCPHLVESTALLTAALLSDDAAAGHSHDAWSTYAVRATYAAAFGRFVTGLLDGHQDQQRKQSMYAVANKIGLPAYFVELRHQSTHEQLPCRARLRSMAKKALKWIWRYYWGNLADDLEPPPKLGPPRCREAVLGCLRGAQTLDQLARWDMDTVLAIVAQLQATLPGNQAFVQCRELRQEILRRRPRHTDAARPTTEQESAGTTGVVDVPEPEPHLESDSRPDRGCVAGSGWSLYRGPWKAKPIGVV